MKRLLIEENTTKIRHTLAAHHHSMEAIKAKRKGDHSTYHNHMELVKYHKIKAGLDDGGVHRSHIVSSIESKYPELKK